MSPLLTSVPNLVSSMFRGPLNGKTETQYNRFLVLAYTPSTAATRSASFPNENHEQTRVKASENRERGVELFYFNRSQITYTSVESRRSLRSREKSAVP